MCGRYTLLITVDEIKKEFGAVIINANFSPSYNIAPSRNVPAITTRPPHLKSIDSYKWGLIPEWSKKEHTSYNLINAKAETIAEKPSFKHSFYNNRCLIPSSGFYEWKKTPDGKIPYYFKLKERKVFAFAGYILYLAITRG